MPLSRSLAKSNRVGLNRLVRHIAPWAPGFGLVVHRGRKSGRTFRTPVNVFVRDGEYVFALTYGARSDWVQNVLAAGTCELITRRATLHLDDPILHDGGARADLPVAVRAVLHVIHVNEFLIMHSADHAV